MHHDDSGRLGTSSDKIWSSQPALYSGVCQSDRCSILGSRKVGAIPDRRGDCQRENPRLTRGNRRGRGFYDQKSYAAVRQHRRLGVCLLPAIRRLSKHPGLLGLPSRGCVDRLRLRALSVLGRFVASNSNPLEIDRRTPYWGMGANISARRADSTRLVLHVLHGEPRAGADRDAFAVVGARDRY